MVYLHDGQSENKEAKESKGLTIILLSVEAFPLCAQFCSLKPSSELAVISMAVSGAKTFPNLVGRGC